jgi:phosphopantothenoylcysteine decarboxylase/phosphopantothenate--cysteine ligase
MSKSKILFQMTGSIACYKACQVISKLVQAGYEVQVVATTSALEFVGNATIEGLTGRPVVSDLYSPGNVMDHIHLVRWADLILVAPASANYLNKIARGVGDDLVTTQFLAHDFKKPFLIAPAMNTAMYLHPVTQESIRLLKSMGVEILETASGVLACGEVGWGRLLEPDLIFQEVQSRLNSPSTGSSPQTGNSSPEKTAPGLSVLITSGGTQENIDPVRVITNKSTGRTGAILADTLSSFGMQVTYLHGEGAKLPSSECHKIGFTNFASLRSRLKETLADSKIQAVIHLAAVSDYSPAESSPRKISSDSDEMVLRLKRNPKLVDQLRTLSDNPRLKVIAFKLTAQASAEEIKSAVTRLMEHSRADLVVHNDTREMTATGHLFHVHSNTGEARDVNGAQELGFYLGDYLMQELL